MIAICLPFCRHAAQFGGKKAIVRAKGELAEAIPGRGLLLLCGDEESAKDHAARASCRIIRVGTGTSKESLNDLIATEVVQDGERLRVTIDESGFEVATSGRHFARSVLFAVAVAPVPGVEEERGRVAPRPFLRVGVVGPLLEADLRGA